MHNWDKRVQAIAVTHTTAVAISAAIVHEAQAATARVARRATGACYWAADLVSLTNAAPAPSAL